LSDAVVFECTAERHTSSTSPKKNKLGNWKRSRRSTTKLPQDKLPDRVKAALLTSGDGPDQQDL
jgi:hypothetical protein